MSTNSWLRFASLISDTADMDALPAPTVAAPPTVEPLPLMPRPLSRRQENYARCVAAGMSYAEAFRQAGCVAGCAGSQSGQIAVMNREPRIRARIAQLRPAADAEAVSTIAERMAWLRMIVNADPEELTRVVRSPCDLCWTDSSIAAAYSAHFAPCEFLEARPALPDPTKPAENCPHCRGRGIMHVEITPTDELSTAGRALYKSASQDKDGVIKVEMQSKADAAEMLNKLQSAYVTRSLNLNANVAIHAARDADPAAALKLFEAFGS